MENFSPLTVECLLKATPRVEGGQRVIYCEPSNEATDMEGERVLRQALADSRSYFLKKGNFDIDHLSLVGYAKGIANPRFYEIGRPTEVKLDEGRTFVKGVIYEGEIHEQANYFWKSLTESLPPMPWFPSVGGHVRDAGTILPKGESAPVRAIKKVYWNNIGFSREPVNTTVPGVTTMPLGAFAKSWIGVGSDLVFKTIAAGYGTDHATLTGGGALRQESLHGVFHTVWNRVLKKIQAGGLSLSGDPHEVRHYLIESEGLKPDEATDALRWFADQRRNFQSKELTHV